MSTVVNQIRKAIVTKCMANGIEDMDEILVLSVKALRSIGTMSVAAYKAHATMRRERIRRKHLR